MLGALVEVVSDVWFICSLAIDTIFLDVERESYLMTIASVWFFEEELTVAHVENEFLKLVARFPRFGHKVVQPSYGFNHWEEDPSFDIKSHVKRITLVRIKAVCTLKV